jgi:DNA-binding response OmpR family regulator
MISLTSEVEPTLLVVGDGFDGASDLIDALTARGIYVEQATVADARQSVVAVAPDLVVLAGDAAGDDLTRVLEELGASPMSSVVPVAVVSEDDELSARLAAFRHGAAAAVSFSEGAEPVADQLSQLVRAIPERSGESVGKLGEATLPELIDALSEEVRSGILSVYGPEDPGAVLRLALGGGKPLASAVSDFVDRVNDVVLDSESVKFGFEERAPGTVSVLSEPPPPSSRSRSEIAGVRALIASQDPASADALAQTLRGQGAEVQLTDFSPIESRVERLSHFDPMVLLIGEKDLSRDGYDFLRRLFADHRLRWASLLVVRWGEVWPDESEPARLEGLVGSIAALTEPDHSAEQRARASTSFDLRLESIGGARLLRALARVHKPLALELTGRRALVRMSLQDGAVVSCDGKFGDVPDQVLSGAPALAAFLVLRSGRVRVAATAPAPASAPPEMALGRVDELLSQLGTEAPIAPSLFPRAITDAIPPPETSEALEQPPEMAADRTWWMRGFSVAGIGVPNWSLVALVALGATAFGVATLRGSPPSTAPAAAAQADSTPAVAATPSSSDTRPAAPDSVLERARRGEALALSELEQLPPGKRTAEQALALSEGWFAKKRTELDALAAQLEHDPSQLDRRDVRRKLIGFSRDASMSLATLRVIAKQKRPIAVDLLYEVWTGTPGRTEATRLAEALVYTAEVRAQASPALSVVLDLRQETDCAKMQAVLERAAEHGDRRSLRPSAKLTLRGGCGEDKTQDCFPCLRKGEELRKTINAVKGRPAPEF